MLAALLSLVAAAMALVVQAAIVNRYIYAAVMGNWTGFPNPPASGPDKYCLDYCVADLPFAAGWIGIGTFLLGLLLVAHAWWKPRA
ncbi:hypothetical protein [Sphingomonas lenta]|uniref:hypothetical protein n=1 Tax=Sphingomonas lenta TaxID=1141887 RepID=UPI001140D497|nr:hypothetical protein [Sphingomonas lenta]